MSSKILKNFIKELNFLNSKKFFSIYVHSRENETRADYNSLKILKLLI